MYLIDNKLCLRDYSLGGSNMNKSILIVAGSLVVLAGGYFLYRDSTQPKVSVVPEQSNVSSPTSAANGPAGSCKEENVSLPNYGDPGKRLKNCFVQYPGEPSRQDKSYYIVEDLCGQFTKEFMEQASGVPIVKVEQPKVDGIFNCTYYLTDKEYVMANLEYLSVENQRKGNVAMDRKVEKDLGIPMDNMVVYQEDGAINVMYLVLGPEKFISFRPSSKSAIANDAFIRFVSNIGREIQMYK